MLVSALPIFFFEIYERNILYQPHKKPGAGWVDGWMRVKAVLRIAYSHQNVLYFSETPSCLKVHKNELCSYKYMNRVLLLQTSFRIGQIVHPPLHIAHNY